ncbi:lon protease 2, peroxisomal [Trichonephila clavipes]|nr:lon protease 2, peroxisomal [Trichonephila clavipes]
MEKAPNTTGKKSGCLALFNQNYPRKNVVFLLWGIHQNELFKSALNLKLVLDAVEKLVNTIRSRKLTHRQFRDFLQPVQSKYSDVLHCTKLDSVAVGASSRPKLTGIVRGKAFLHVLRRRPIGLPRLTQTYPIMPDVMDMIESDID